MSQFSVAATQKSKLGAMLIRKGLITPEQMEEVLRRQKGSNEKCGEIIVSMGLLTKKQIDRALMKQCGYRYAIAFATALSAPFTPMAAAASAHADQPTYQTSSFSSATYTSAEDTSAHLLKVATSTLTMQSTTTSTNLAPVITGTPGTLATEGTLYSFKPTAYDPEGKALLFKIKNKPAWATFNSTTGKLSGTPTAANVGIYYNITIVASDGSKLTYMPAYNLEVKTNVVTPTNQAPTATAGAYSTNMNQAISHTFSATDPNGDPITFSIVSAPAHGNVVVTNASTGAFTYSPANGYVGADTFTFSATDSQGASATASISVNMNSVNSAPVASSGSLILNEDTAAQGSLIANDPDGDALTYSISTQPTHGTITLTNAATGAYSYQPSANYSGPDSFGFQVSDGQGGSSSATVQIDVQSINDAPVTTSSTQAVAEDTPVTGRLSATDVDSTSFSFNLVNNVTHGTLTLDSLTGSYTYTPAANYAGSDSFTYDVSDGSGGTASATVTFDISGINDTPVAQAGAYTGIEDTIATGTLHATDADADTLAFTISGSALHGTVTITNAATGTFSYTPQANYSGSDSFTFMVSDGHGGQATAQASISVSGVNDAPTAASASFQGTEDMPLTGQVSGTDVEGSDLTYSIVSNAAHGTVSLNSTNGNFTFTPAPNYNGSDGFSFRVTDAQGLSSNALVSISVASVDDIPVAMSDNATTSTNTPVTVSVLNNDTNLGDGGIQVSIASQPGHGTASVSNNQVVYTPASNYSGTDNISYRITDADGDTAVATIAITATCTQNCPADISLHWTAPTTRTDGTALTNLTGYLVHYGTSPGVYTNSVDVVGGSTLAYTILKMPAGTYHFAITAYDANGNESGYSAEVSQTTH